LLQVLFEAGGGQRNRQAAFSARGMGYELALTRDSARLPGVSNYFVGKDRSRWRAGIEQFGQVR